MEVVQEESFDSLKDKIICDLHPYKDKMSIIRVKDKIAQRDSFKLFTTPILLLHMIMIQDDSCYGADGC